MSSAEGESTMEGIDDVAASSLGILDLFLIAGLLFAAVYWLFIRKKKDSFDPSSMKAFSIETTMMRTETTGFISKMKSHNRNIVVFYGSQTGTAEEFAARLAKDAPRYGLKAMVADPEECDMEELTKLPEIENSMAVFCMATYGEGDPTDNAQDFNQWLQDGNVDLNGVRYAVFALGNKTYEHYNATGRFVDRRMAELGAEKICPLGEGDDDANIEEDFLTWKEVFWAAIKEKFNLQEREDDGISVRQYTLIEHEDIDPDRVFHGEMTRIGSYKNQRPPFDAKNPFMSQICEFRELFKESSGRSCMHIELDLEGSRLRYEAGDHVGIYPQNELSIVEKFGSLFNVDLDKVISLKNVDEDSSKKYPFPCPTSYRTALTFYVDIQTPPRTHLLKLLADNATDEKDKAQLLLMCSPTPEGKSMYQSWVHNDCRSIVHILEDMPSARPPLDHLLELMPRLQCRYYSISSSPKVSPNRVHVTAVSVDYTTPTNRRVVGVATGWLASKPPQIPIFIRRSQFKLPTRHQIPIIMVGPGTGLAPFRGFLQERDFFRKEGREIGTTILFYGCRNRASDFLYAEELENFAKNGTLTHFFKAFSRDQPNKVYVTHHLRENRELIWQLIGQQNAHFYVCGDAKNMARDVHNILREILRDLGQMSEADADSFLKKMESQRRYSADVWS